MLTTPKQLKRDIQEQFRDLVDAKLREGGWTRADLAREASLDEEWLDELLDRDCKSLIIVDEILVHLGLAGRLEAVPIDPGTSPS